MLNEISLLGGKSSVPVAGFFISPTTMQTSLGSKMPIFRRVAKNWVIIEFETKKKHLVSLGDTNRCFQLFIIEIDSIVLNLIRCNSV